jgi:hypothetical protein
VATEPEPVNSKADRVLGDGWEDWETEPCAYEADTETGKSWFLGIAALIIVLIVAGLGVFWYLISPRLEMMSRGLSAGVGLLFLVAGVFLLVWVVLLALTTLTERNFLPSGFLARLVITLIPMAMSVGSRLGLSRDRLANSFIRVHNSLLRTGIIEICRDRPIVLAPRCLRDPIKREILELSKRYHCQVFTVGGGSAARKIIGRNKPSAIIAIACERDLLSGIREVAPRIPTIGIPNRRPAGPCKDTEVDIEEVEEALRFSVEGRSSGR